MNARYETEAVAHEAAPAPVLAPAPIARRSLTAGHLEPWRENTVELTLTDGTHRVGLLKRIENGTVQLQAARGAAALPDGCVIRIHDTIAIKRA